MNINANDIRLFLENETNFDHNKYVLNEAIECYVTETTDGLLDLDMIYLLNDKKQLSNLLARKNIIKSAISQTDARGEQLFAIRKRSTSTKDNRITIYAQAKARRDLDVNMVLGLEVPAGSTRKTACQMILNKCAVQQGYYIGNLDTNTATNINLGLDEKTGNVINYLDISGISPLKAFLDDSQNSIAKAWGGEIIYNNNEINIVDERGTDYNILIESGKNLEELQQDIDDTDTENFATAVLPCSNDGVYLPNSEVIYSPNANTLGKVFKRVVFDDVTLVNNTQEAFNVVYAQLRERTQKLFDNGLDKLKINNTIKYTQFKNTEEYKPYAKLFTEKCEIGNNVTVRYYMKNDPTKYIDAVGRVVKIKYNVLKGRIEEIEIGDRKKKSVLDTITDNNNKSDDLILKTGGLIKGINNITENITVINDNINDLTVTMEKSDSDILLEVRNNKTNTDTAIQVMDGEIQERVTTTDFQSYRTQTAQEIDQCVKTDNLSSEIIQRADSIVEAIQDTTGSHTCTFDSAGLTVQNGGFKIKNSSGETVMWINSDGYVKVEDIEFGESAFSNSSWLVSSFANIDKLTLANLSIGGRLIVDQSDFYMTYNGQNGYDFKTLVRTILSEENLI